MNMQAVTSLVNNPAFVFLSQVLLFSLPPFYLATLRQPLRSAAFYVYISIVLVLGGFLGSVYSIPLTESIRISGGNLSYGALMLATILLIIIDDDPTAIRNVIRLVITVNVLKYVLFSVLAWQLGSSVLINPFETAADLFSTSVKFMLIGGFLIILELLLLLLVFEQLKARVGQLYVLAASYAVGFVAVLCLDGILFPLLAFGFDPALMGIVVGGFAGKFLMAAAYSIALLLFLILFQTRVAAYLKAPLPLRQVLRLSTRELLDEIERQRASIGQKERALRESEERLRLALEAANQGLYDLNLITGTAEVNDQYALMLGYDPDTFAETNAAWLARLHPDDRPRVQAYFEAYVRGEFPDYRIDFRQKTRAGDYIWIASLGRIVAYDADGKPLRLLGTHTDITERKQTEEALAETAAKYRNLVETSHDLVWSIDAEARITFMNQAARRIYGREPAEMIGHPYVDFIPPDQIESNAQSWAMAIDNDDRIINFENWVLHKDGTRVCLSANAVLIRDELGNIVGSMGTSQDITARKQADEQLQYQAFLLANVSEAIISTDAAFRIVSWNRAAERLYGWSAGDVLGKRMGDAVPTVYTDSTVEQVLQQFQRDGSWLGEVVQTRRDGQPLHIWSTVTQLVDEAGQLIGAVAVNRDVSERKAAEDRQRELLERLNLAIASAQMGVWEVDMASGRIQWNDRLLEMFGTTREAFDADPDAWRATIHPDDRAYFEQQQAIAFQGDTVFDVTFRILHPSGETRTLTASAGPLLNAAGKLVKVIGSILDLTDKMQREAALKEREAQLIQAQQIGGLGSWQLDIARDQLSWSDQVYEIFGEARERFQVSYANFLTRVHPEDQAQVQQAQEATLRDGVPLNVEHRIVRPDGEIRYLHERAQVMRAADGRPERLTGTVQDITKRKRVEQELRQRNEFIEMILDNLPIGLAVNEIERGATTYMNARFEAIYGWPRAALTDVERFFASVYPDPAYREHMRLRILDDIASGDPRRMEWQGIEITTQAGEKRYVFAKNIPMLEQNFMISTVQDITARRLAEQRLQEYTERLEILLEIDRAILSQDSPERIAQVAVDHLARLISCERISAAWFDEAESAAIVLALRTAGETTMVPGVRVPLGDSEQMLVELRRGESRLFPDLQQLAGQSAVVDQLLAEQLRSFLSVPLFAGGRLIGTLSLGSAQRDRFDDGVVRFVREVADQVAIALLQARLHEAEQAQRMLAETLQQTAVTLVGSLGLAETLDTILNQLALVVQHDLAQVLLIQGDALVVGAYRGKLAEGDTRHAIRPYTDIPLLNDALQYGRPLILAEPELTGDASLLPGMAPGLASWIGIPLVARDVAVGFLTAGRVDRPVGPGEINAIAAFARQAALAIEKATILMELERSVSQLRETQAQMVRAARLSAIGETAAGVAHQINNPLTTVIVDSHLLQQQLPDSHPAQQSAQAIHQAALRAAGVVERLLDFSRAMPTRQALVSIVDSVQESIDLLRAQLPQGVQLVVQLEADLPQIRASSEHLQDVWLNLLLNARDAVKDLPEGRIEVTAVHNGTANRLEVAIRDNGIGIPAEQLGQVFNPFFTTKSRGTGLGLAVCQDIIAHHEGEIQVASVVNGGSVFTVLLPIRP